MTLYSEHFEISRLFFLKALSLVYLLAFGSLLPQIAGLVGENGIIPIRDTLVLWRELPPARRYFMFPTLTWIHAGDAALRLTCLTGMLFSVLAFLGIGQAPALVFLWVLYLTLTISGQEFLSFQWDALLLETGFLAIFLVPWPRTAVSPIAIAVLWWLLFRLMFESGVVKLSCRDRTWREGTALDFHYYTQPLPTAAAWYAAKLPAWFQRLSVQLMFAIEIGLPFLIFTPAPWRYAAAAGFILLQILIAWTGNYGFFNLLSIVLCLPLIDDNGWAAVSASSAAVLPVPSRLTQLPIAIVASVVALVSIPQLIRALFPAWRLPRYARALERMLRPFYLVNSYGLFRNMTTSRPEIRIEGSHDGEEWREYEFRYKPSDLRQRPRRMAPHHPRLDWQMWFAALGGFEGTEWFGGLLLRLFQASPPVLGLLKKNPFPEGAPKYLRAQLFDYRFTSLAERSDSGLWWRRKFISDFSPTLTLAQRSLP